MSAAVFDPRAAETSTEAPAPATARDWLTLVRPRIAVLVLVTVATGACLAEGRFPDPWILLHALIGTALVASASSAFNQIWERDTDALMRRTGDRPLVAGRLTPRTVFVVASLASVVGLVELWLGASPTAALVAFASLVTYVLGYTPLKRYTTLNTAVGAVPGALPPLIGWAAVTDSLAPAAWTLFGIVFVWQFPHFLAIASLNRDDYGRAGLKMLPVVDARLTGWQAVNYALALLPVSLAPAVLGMAGRLYFVGALYLGLAFLGVCVHFLVQESRPTARRLLLASIVYLPALFGLLWADRVPGI